MVKLIRRNDERWTGAHCVWTDGISSRVMKSSHGLRISSHVHTKGKDDVYFVTHNVPSGLCVSQLHTLTSLFLFVWATGTFFLGERGGKLQNPIRDPAHGVHNVPGQVIVF
jgi:hypothetical protein